MVGAMGFAARLRPRKITWPHRARRRAAADAAVLMMWSDAGDTEGEQR
jgi:hypothetical protein